MTFRELIEELVAAWTSGDALRASAFFATGGSYHESGALPVVGREAIAEYFARFFRDGPAWRFDVLDIIVDGDRAAVEYRFFLHRQGAWESREGCALVRREGGSIAQWREYHG
ncbi:MAG TPA: nuclear transport factor 2 family protein [Candidatus Aquilonibacter sp.]|nr:nuclear transport factor 2 family protein [Candidatus Aquilonibacter sp.]